MRTQDQQLDRACAPSWHAPHGLTGRFARTGAKVLATLAVALSFAWSESMLASLPDGAPTPETIAIQKAFLAKNVRPSTTRHSEWHDSFDPAFAQAALEARK